MPSSRRSPPPRPGARGGASPAGRGGVGGRRPPAPPPEAAPLDAPALDALQDALDALPAPLEPLDLAAVDGLLCAMIVQPVAVPRARWLALALDGEGRPAPAGSNITARRWFDPWLFDDAADTDDDTERDAAARARALVEPWVTGFAIGFDAFPALHDAGGPEMLEGLAYLYRHFDADDLEDADELLAAIDVIGPALDVEDAVEGLVRGTLLLADVADGLRG